MLQLIARLLDRFLFLLGNRRECGTELVEERGRVLRRALGALRKDVQVLHFLTEVADFAVQRWPDH